MTKRLSKEECERTIALFDMTERASREDADEHVRNEGAVAATKLIQFLGKLGLSFADIGEIQRQYAEYQVAATATSSAGGAAQPELPLFAPAVRRGGEPARAAVDALREALAAIDPDDLSPRAALEALYALRRLLGA